MKYKIVEEHYDELKREYSITIQNKYGQFTGKAYCRRDDIPSVYTGARYAEMRATIAFAKFRYNQEKVKLNTVKNLYKDLTYNGYLAQMNEKAIHAVNIKIRDYSQSMQNWKNLYEYLEKRIPELDKEREKILERANKDK